MVQIPTTTPGAGLPRGGPGSQETRDFVRLGIDDLAKFRIIEFLNDNPSVVGDCHFYSDNLGIKPAEYARRLLDEMAARGILVRCSSVDGKDAYYAFNSTASLSQNLVMLYQHVRATSCYGSVMARLAQRSLEKARSRARKARRVSTSTGTG